MYISDTDIKRQKLYKTAFRYLLVGLFCAFFGAVYEHFSHEVYSYYMIYAFAFPLIGGALPLFALLNANSRRLPGKASLNLYGCGIAALTVGSVLKGVIAIYGTTNSLIDLYWYVGAALTAAGLLTYLLATAAKTGGHTA